MPPPNSRLMKPKTISSSASTSVKSGLVKPLGIKQTATHLPSVKNSKLSKMAPSGRSEPVKRQTTAQSVKLKNQMRSKLAVPSAGLKKKKTAVGVENPTTKKVPLTSSTPITCRYLYSVHVYTCTIYFYKYVQLIHIHVHIHVNVLLSFTMHVCVWCTCTCTCTCTCIIYLWSYSMIIHTHRVASICLHV